MGSLALAQQCLFRHFRLCAATCGSRHNANKCSGRKDRKFVLKLEFVQEGVPVKRANAEYEGKSSALG